MTDLTPQFSSAEYSNVSGTERCAACQQLIGPSYYRMNGAMVCTSCGDKAKSGLPVENRASYMKALLYGAGGAFAGFIGYALFTIMTGWQIGYVSLGVGFLVGAAMKKGAGGYGGRKYQITAALLTYAAVSMAAIPISLYYDRQHNSQGITQQQSQGSASDKGASSEESGKPDAQQTSRSEPGAAGVALGVGVLALIGLASPFLELASSPGSGLIGLFILFIGIRYAWQATAALGIAVDGPFENGTKASGATAG